MDSAFKKLIYWSGHTHSLLGLAVHQLSHNIIHIYIIIIMNIRITHTYEFYLTFLLNICVILKVTLESHEYKALRICGIIMKYVLCNMSSNNSY